MRYFAICAQLSSPSSAPWIRTQPGPMSAERLAVIDLGPNSRRVLVARLVEVGHLDVLETEGTPLRLVHELATSASLGDEAIERTVEALEGFKAIARGAGAERAMAVATAAVREAIDGQ